MNLEQGILNPNSRIKTFICLFFSLKAVNVPDDANMCVTNEIRNKVIYK